MDTEKAVLNACFHARSMYKKTKEPYWNSAAESLWIAHKELSHYHKLKDQIFPSFTNGEGGE